MLNICKALRRSGGDSRERGSGVLGLALIALMLSTSPASGASRERLPQPIPAGPLAESLLALAESSGWQLVFDPELVAGRVAPRIEADARTLSALEALLRGSGLEYVVTGPGALALRRKPTEARVAPRQNSAASPSELAGVTVRGSRLGTPADADSAHSALREDAPILRTPAMIDVVSQARLEALGASRLEQALDQVPGLQVIPSGVSALAFALRGFPTQQYYLDGVRISPDVHQDGFRELANVERIEILQGPASILFGRGEPGGVINVVTKEPPVDPLVAMALNVGAFGESRGALDLGGALGADGRLRGRLNAAYDEAHSYRDFIADRRVFIAPVLAWDIADSATVTGYGEYLTASDFNEAGLPLIGTNAPQVPIGRNLLGPGASIRTRDARLGAKSLIQLGRNWQLRPRLDARWLSTPAPAQFGLDVDGLDPAACSWSRCAVDRLVYANPVSTGRTLYASTDLVGSLAGPAASQELLVGAEFFDARNRYDLVSRSDPRLAIDLYAPFYNHLPSALLDHPDVAYSEVGHEQWFALYAQDRIRWSNGLALLVGGRGDFASEKGEFDDLGGSNSASIPANNAVRESSFKPKIAFLYEASDTTSLYASYSEHFGLANGRAHGGLGGDGAPLPPETAQQWEIGWKRSPSGSLPGWSLALFDLTKQHIAVADSNPTRAAQGYLRAVGEARSRGVELEWHTARASHWSAGGTIDYADTRIVRDSLPGVDDAGNPIITPGNTGKRLFGVPRFSGGTWLDLSPDGHWRLELAVQVHGRRMGDNANDYQLGGYSIWSLMVARQWVLASSRLDVQLNVRNAGAARYAESLLGSYEIVPGAPRAWLLGARWTL